MRSTELPDLARNRNALSKQIVDILNHALALRAVALHTRDQRLDGLVRLGHLQSTQNTLKRCWRRRASVEPKKRSSQKHLDPFYTVEIRFDRVTLEPRFLSGFWVGWFVRTAQVDASREASPGPLGCDGVWRSGRHGSTTDARPSGSDQNPPANPAAKRGQVPHHPADRANDSARRRSAGACSSLECVYVCCGRLPYRVLRVQALWKGNGTGLVMVSLYNAVQFAAFNQFQRAAQAWGGDAGSGSGRSREVRSVGLNLLGGAYASVIATTATYPFDLARTRLAAQHANKVSLLRLHRAVTRTGAKRVVEGAVCRGLGCGSGQLYPTLRYALSAMYREGGVRGLYCGYRATVTGIVPYMACTFATYHGFQRALIALKQVRSPHLTLTRTALARHLCSPCHFVCCAVLCRARVTGH